jgi:ATP-dependent DNA ligase
VGLSLAIEPENQKVKKKAHLDNVSAGSVASVTLEDSFPAIDLAVHPPFAPAEAKPVAEIPRGEEWLYEPKWDGFRCLAFRHGDKVLLQSKAGQPLHRYFPELVESLSALPQQQFVLDGEIVIYLGKRLSFEHLLMRIHPAASRIRKLSTETPSSYMCFDLLVDDQGRPLTNLPLSQRRERLAAFFGKLDQDDIQLSPASRDRHQADKWMHELGRLGLDGIIAKRLDQPYPSGKRTGMVKVKRIRTADVVVGGFRYAAKGGGIGSLLLGLYNSEGLLDHVGFTSSFNGGQQQELKSLVGPLALKLENAKQSFTGNAPGGPSRWSTKRSSEWTALKPELVAEVQYDHFSEGRFRHGTKFLRWRPEKTPKDCKFDQVA